MFVNNIVIGELNEIRNHKRIIDFSSNPTIEKKYNALPTSLKRIVNNVILELCENKEHTGYNLKKTLEWIKFDKVKLRDLYKEILHASFYIDFENLLELSDEEYEQSSDEEYFGLQLNKLERKVNKKLTSPHIKDKDSDFSLVIDALCKMYLISPRLIYDGFGEIYVINEKYLDANVLKEINTHINFKKEQIWNTKLYYEKCQEIVSQYISKTEKVYEVKYATFIKYGGYQLLSNSKKVAVNGLINDLYELELDEDFEFVEQDYIEKKLPILR